MIKLLIGGSPCTYWTIARAATQSKITRETKNEGVGWELFLNYKIALDKFQPDIFLYENVSSMSDDIKESITAHLGTIPYLMRGGLVSAAERDRYFWTNIRNVDQPEDRNLVLGDVLEADVPEKYFYNDPVENVDMGKQVCATLMIKNQEIHKRVFNPKFKIHTLTAVCGGGHHKKVMVNGRVRKLTPLEYERCMTMPDGYTYGVADSHRYKALGNGWTAEIVIHILGRALADIPRDEKIVVLSLYDGIATGRYCLDKMGFTNVEYFAYEIDKYAKQIALKNYPDIIQCGDAFDVRNPDWTINAYTSV